MVRMSVGSQPVDFMVDTGTKHLLVTLRVAPISKRHQTIVGATIVAYNCRDPDLLLISPALKMYTESASCDS
jgi:hypothetical protein